jgi:hypothetical protein
VAQHGYWSGTRIVDVRLIAVDVGKPNAPPVTGVNVRVVVTVAIGTMCEPPLQVLLQDAEEKTPASVAQ